MYTYHEDWMKAPPCICTSSYPGWHPEPVWMNAHYGYGGYPPFYPYYDGRFPYPYGNSVNPMMTQQTASCFSNSDCPAGQICNGITCTAPECSGDAECAQYGKYCGNGRCLSLACNPVAPCPSGYTCSDKYFMCMPNSCSQDKQCPEGMHCSGGNCVPIEYNSSCLGTCGCREHNDCPLGYSCITNLCVPWGCKSDAECQSIKPGSFCVEGSCITEPPCQGNKGGCVDASKCDISGQDTTKNHVLVVQNRSSQDIYVGSFGQVLDPVSQVPKGPYSPNNGGWLLKSGESSIVTVPLGWQGRFWGRTGCTFDASGVGSCETGDCDRQLHCTKTGEAGATLIEFNLDSNPGGTFAYPVDFYDISLVDGLNLMAEITPIASTINKAANNNPDRFWCTPIGCDSQMFSCCPEELKKKNAAGKTVACMTACTQKGAGLAGNPMYCCPMQTWDQAQGKLVNSIWGAPANCIPSKWDTNYTAFFKNRCPDQYSFAYDDMSSTNTCTSGAGQLSAYCIAFCDA